eukprot:Rhum_TRINITY_DN14170_c10_g1::Rhum_TRINITY_DN14170_c10_g1_i1::g.72806::m.72806
MKFASTAAALLLCTSAAAHYCPPKCTDAPTDFSGSMGVVDYPGTTHGHYKNDENRCWRFHCSGVLEITWESLDLEVGYDFAEVYKLENGQYNIVHRRSHALALPLIETINGNALVRLESDNCVTNKGFRFSWTCSATPPPDMHVHKEHFCGPQPAHQVTDGKGYVAYPASGCYPNDETRCYEFVCPVGQDLSLELTRLNVQRNADYLELWHVADGHADRLEWKDDKRWTFPARNFERDMLLRFTSDALIGDTGFNITYECGRPTPPPTPVPEHNVTCRFIDDIRQSGKLHHVAYENNQDMCWLVNCPGGQVTLAFDLIDTEHQYDFVWVYEYDHLQKTYENKERYSGRVPNAGGVYDGSVVVRFKSDAYVKGHGLDFTYNCVHAPQIPM